jgi:hypothetical protein
LTEPERCAGRQARIGFDDVLSLGRRTAEEQRRLQRICSGWRGCEANRDEGRAERPRDPGASQTAEFDSPSA